MAEENKDNPESKPKHVKETYLIIGAFVLMIAAIITIWQVLLKGKMDEESSKQKDTVLQVRVDTLKIKDSLQSKNTPVTQTDKTASLNSETKTDTSKDQPKLKNLTEEDKSKLKEKFEDLPKSKRDRMKKNLRSKLNN
jgi:hypothetical protein